MRNSAICYLEDTAARFPDRIAVADAFGELSYRALRERSRALASGLLHAFGPAQSAEPVIVFLPKSVESVVSFLGALYAGRCYAPLDYACPLLRMQDMITHMQPRAVITDEKGMEALSALALGDAQLLRYDMLAASPVDEPAVDAALDAVIDTDAAYIMYTSGSTGVPKGVVIPHRGILDYADWLTEEFSIDENTVFGLQSGFHFDNSVFDLYGALKTGARMEIIPEVLFMYPEKLLGLLAEKRVSCIFWVPTVMISTANSGALSKVPLPDLKTVVFAGEVMPNKQLNIWRQALPGRVFANLYGPTEITVDCTYYIVDRDFADADPLPIGIPCPNMRVLLLREDGTPAPDGEQGEICVLGSGVANGYWNAPEQTAKVFVQNPLNPYYTERMYRTGDLGVKAPDGNIMYLGRGDSQFKLRGNRIELGDIEAAAVCIDGVQNACALFDRENEQIVLCLETPDAWTLRRLNVELGKRLPKYMLPQRLICMEAFPLTPNKKIDRVTLKRTLIEDAGAR